MAGRCMSVTHVALGSVRVEAPCCVTGQAAGTGAALAIRYGMEPRRLCSSRMAEVQQVLLENDVYIPGVRGNDSANLARTAEVSCSSLESADSRPENVLNGWARPLEGNGNMWKSNSKQAFPQWIQLNFKTALECNAISCTFDTNLNPNAWESGIIPMQCIRDYRLECRVKGKWHVVAAVRDNYQRFCRHRFPAMKADAVRLTILATNGIRSARVFEIHAYNEPA